MISNNLTFGKWEQIFRNPMTAMAGVDRLVQHSIILHFDGDSLRARLAQKNLENQQGQVTPPA